MKETTSMEVDVLALLRALCKHIWLIAAALLLCGAAAFCIASFAVTPQYKASVMMYVNNSSQSGSNKDSISSSDLSAAQSLVDTYVVILNTRMTLDEVAKRAGVDYTYEELKDMISASSVNSTEVFSISVSSEDPAQAQRLVTVISQVLPERISQVVEGSSVRVVDNAVLPTKQASPNRVLYALVGALIGLVLSCGYVLLRELLDDRIRSEDTLMQMYPNIPVLAAIPELTANAGGYGYRQETGRSGKGSKE